jgi:hypothetical protein
MTTPGKSHVVEIVNSRQPDQLHNIDQERQSRARGWGKAKHSTYTLAVRKILRSQYPSPEEASPCLTLPAVTLLVLDS